MKILNYTVYSTEDIRALAEAAEKKASKKTRGARFGRPVCLPDTLTVNYWKGWAANSAVAVRPDLRLAGAGAAEGQLRIKKPEQLPISEVEMLAMIGSPVLPESITRQIWDALSRACGNRRAKGFSTKSKIRIVDAPEMVEGKEERAARISAKKLNKALRAATSVGLRMGPSQTQANKRVESLAAVEHLMDDNQKELLSAYREYANGMLRVSAAASKCRNPKE
jgi:hypothetical protein